MAKPKNTGGEPLGDRAIKFMKLAGKEMIDTLDDHQLILAGKCGNERFHFCDGAVLVVAPVHKQLGLVALAQE